MRPTLTSLPFNTEKLKTDVHIKLVSKKLTEYCMQKMQTELTILAL